MYVVWLRGKPQAFSLGPEASSAELCAFRSFRRFNRRGGPNPGTQRPGRFGCGTAQSGGRQDRSSGYGFLSGLLFVTLIELCVSCLRASGLRSFETWICFFLARAGSDCKPFAWSSLGSFVICATGVTFHVRNSDDGATSTKFPEFLRAWPCLP